MGDAEASINTDAGPEREGQEDTTLLTASDGVEAAAVSEEAGDDLRADHIVQAPEEEEEEELEEQAPNPWAADWHEKIYQDQLQAMRMQMREKLLDREKVPTPYYTTSKKEALVLTFVENFHRQYSQLFPGRKELILFPENEFGVKLPFKELYDYRSCAKFVADYLTYEPLEPPHELSGNCFDFSILLVSILRGFGYDAYVVSGYATVDITVRDETKTDADIAELGPGLRSETLFDFEQSTLNDPNALKYPSNKYKLKPPRQLRSQFLLKQEEKRKERERLAAEKQRLEAEKKRASMEEDEDELKGLRVHAWVLVLPGKREIAESFFIEPTTGRIYSTDNENFLGVESVFNSNNYWVNMQVCYDGLKGIQFDLADNTKWEFVLLDNNQPGLTARDGSGSDELQEKDEPSDDEGNDGDDDSGNGVLDLPPPWPEKLEISKLQLESKCPAGSKSVTY
ncbi:hypothetical protein HK405_012218, partial [Cladochytrium tenue]